MNDTPNPPRRKRSEVAAEKKADPTQAPAPPAEPDAASKSWDAYDNDLFKSVNAPGEPVLHAGFQGIVDSMVDSDPKGTYDMLVAELKLDTTRLNDRGMLRVALNDAADNARRAHLLYCNALVEQKRYDIDADPVFGAMWSNAVEALEREAEEAEDVAAEMKEKGRRKPPKKNITNEDVKARAAAMHPDQWRRHHLGVERVKAMVLHTKELAEQWGQRCRTLESLLAATR